jgi:hypothetical protein
MAELSAAGCRAFALKHMASTRSKTERRFFVGRCGDLLRMDCRLSKYRGTLKSITAENATAAKGAASQ